jgi:hypothetical protein
MKENKVIELIKSFSPAELKKFGDFVKSPFFNKNVHIISMYEYFNKHSSDLDKLKLNYEDIFRFIFRSEKYSELKVRSIISTFVKLIEQYLVYISSSKNIIYQKTLLVNTLHQRNLIKNFRSALKETMEYQKKQFTRDEDYYYNQIYLEVDALNHLLERNTKINEDDFHKIGENQNLYFILTKLNLLHFMFLQMREATDSHGQRVWMMNEIITYIESNLPVISKEHPLIYMKYLILMTMMKPEQVINFNRLKKFVTDNHDKLSGNVQAYIFKALTDYCALRCNGPDPAFKNERFKVYKIMEDKGILNKSKFITVVDFINAIISALETGKFLWADKFLNKYKDRVLPELHEAAINLAKTQIFFYKKKYDDALETLNNVSYNNHYFYLQSKKMLAKIYFEKNDYESITYIIDTTRHYLKRNSGISRINWELFSKFFVYLKRLINLDAGQKEKISTALEDLNKENSVSSKEWLLNKFTELEQS